MVAPPFTARALLLPMLIGFGFCSWAAPITYPNQAHMFYGNEIWPVQGMYNLKAVAVYGDFILGVTRNGRVVSSGVPDHWLDEGIAEQLTNIVAVGINHTSAAALTSGGRIIDLGSSPHPQPPNLTNVVAMDVCGQYGDDDLDYKLAVTGDGKVVVWGYLNVPQPEGLDGVIAAAGGWSHIVALKSNGTVVTWGSNPEEQTSVPAGLTNVIAVAAGGMHSVALNANGTVVVWGDDLRGQLNVPQGLSNVVGIAAKEYHTLALKRDGTVVGWGENYYTGSVIPASGISNVMGFATSGSKSVVISRAAPSPAPIIYPNQAYGFYRGEFSPLPGITNVKAVAVEGGNVLAVTQDGRVIQNGGVMVGQHSNVVGVALSYALSAALTADGRVIEFTDPEYYPQPPGLTNVIALDVTGQFFDDDLDYKVAVTSEGKVFTWGQNNIPSMPDLDGVISVAGGWGHVVALRSDGTVVSWGYDSNDQTNVPPGLSNVIAVAAGGTHSVALKADGTVVAWGDDGQEQLDIPAGLTNVIAIAASESHTLALRSDGTLAAWGMDYFGGDVTPPEGLSNVIAIATSGTQNVVIVRTQPQPRLDIGSSTAASLSLTLTGEQGRVFTIETSYDLVSWQPVLSVTNEMGITSFNVEKTGTDKQFFRVKTLVP